MLKTLMFFWRRISSGPRERQAMALLRIVTGLFFLSEGHYRLINAELESQLYHQLSAWANTASFSLFGDLIRQVALPHLHQLANLTTDAQILVGVSYVSGLLLPLAAGLAVLLNLLFLVANLGNPAAVGLNLCLCLISLTLFWGRAGQQFGLDELLRLSLPRHGGQRRESAARTSPVGKKNRVKTAVQRSAKKMPNKIKPKAKPSRPVAFQPAKTEKVRKLTPPPNLREKPTQPQSAKVRKLEKVLKREADKQKRQEVAKLEPKPEKAQPIKLAPAPEPSQGSPVEEKDMKVVRIFDHRTPDDDD